MGYIEAIKAATGCVVTEPGIDSLLLNHTEEEDPTDKQVVDMFMNSDLRKIECTPVLPTLSGKTLTLEGPFFIQINRVLDVSKPAKQQTEDSGLNRILTLNVSDGNTSANIMEVNRIPFLSTKTSPGTKAILEGPLKVINGYVQLESPSQLRILGGKVQRMVDALSAAVETAAARAAGVKFDKSLQAPRFAPFTRESAKHAAEQLKQLKQDTKQPQDQQKEEGKARFDVTALGGASETPAKPAQSKVSVDAFKAKDVPERRQRDGKSRFERFKRADDEFRDEHVPLHELQRFGEQAVSDNPLAEFLLDAGLLPKKTTPDAAAEKKSFEPPPRETPLQLLRQQLASLHADKTMSPADRQVIGASLKAEIRQLEASCVPEGSKSDGAKSNHAAKYADGKHDNSNNNKHGKDKNPSHKNDAHPRKPDAKRPDRKDVPEPPPPKQGKQPRSDHPSRGSKAPQTAGGHPSTHPSAVPAHPSTGPSPASEPAPRPPKGPAKPAAKNEAPRAPKTDTRSKQDAPQQPAAKKGRDGIPAKPLEAAPANANAPPANAKPQTAEKPGRKQNGPKTGEPQQEQGQRKQEPQQQQQQQQHRRKEKQAAPSEQPTPPQAPVILGVPRQPLGENRTSNEQRRPPKQSKTLDANVKPFTPTAGFW